MVVVIQFDLIILPTFRELIIKELEFLVFRPKVLVFLPSTDQLCLLRRSIRLINYYFGQLVFGLVLVGQLTVNSFSQQVVILELGLELMLITFISILLLLLLDYLHDQQHIMPYPTPFMPFEYLIQQLKQGQLGLRLLVLELFELRAMQLVPQLVQVSKQQLLIIKVLKSIKPMARLLLLQQELVKLLQLLQDQCPQILNYFTIPGLTTVDQVPRVTFFLQQPKYQFQVIFELFGL